MASYDVTVDTRDMAHKMDTVTDKVSNVKTAVVAMEAAVIAAEIDASKRVCKKLNKGFLVLITSQIEQKNATALSEVEAYAAELMQQGESLEDLQRRMGDDFLILTDRYSKLFNGLNSALHNRIYELDKPVMHFCEKEVFSTNLRVRNLIASVPVNQSESVSVSQAIAAAHIKHNARLLIEKMKNFLVTTKKQSNKTESIKLHSAIGKTDTYTIPAILTVAENEHGNQVAVELPQGIDAVLNGGQENKVRQELLSQVGIAQWKMPDSEAQRNILGEFERMMLDTNASQRVKDTMKKLYQNGAKWQTLKEG